MKKTLILLALALAALAPATGQTVKQLENERKATLQKMEATSKLLDQTKQSQQSSLNKLNLLSTRIRERQSLISTINREGEAIGSYYAWKAIGIYRTEADLNRTNSRGQVIKQNGQAPQLGDLMYEDFNDDGDITDADRQIIGNPFPKLQYSFNLGFTYKNLDVTTFWQGVAGLNRFNWDETTISNGGNKTSRWLDRWSPENPNGSMPRMGGTINNTMSSFWLTKGDYLRLKNIEIGYTFKKEAWMNKIGVQSLRLYLAGTNLLTFTSLDDYDPEKQSGDTRNDVHPNTKTYSFGINVKF